MHPAPAIAKLQGNQAVLVRTTVSFAESGCPMRASRRQFLQRVGGGMFVASVGSSLALDMGLIARAEAVEQESRVTFGEMEPLVDFLQSTPVEKLLPQVAQRVQSGTPLQSLVAAAALANARAFGGEDYIGFHTLMALGPALAMSKELPSEQAALPVMKVLYRNSARIQETGGPSSEILKPVPAGEAGDAATAADRMREAVHQGDRAKAAQVLAGSTSHSPKQGFEDLLHTVEESADVHRVVLMHRAWDMLSIVGEQNALSMLRQSLGYCLKNEPYAIKYAAECRAVLPKVMDQFKLETKAAGKREADEAWILAIVNTLFTSTPTQAAEAVGAALAEGFSPLAIGEAISLTANQLVLRDAGRSAKEVQPGKPEGSVHGDSIGVHASDSAHAWRHISMACGTRNQNAALVLAGYQVALDRIQRGGSFDTWKPRPWDEHLTQVKGEDENTLKQELVAAIESNNQAMACAVTARMGTRGISAEVLKGVFLRYAISQDGALHAEKYYKTTTDDFASTRSSLQWRHLVGLARVTASEYGRNAAGVQEARSLLGLG